MTPIRLEGDDDEDGENDNDENNDDDDDESTPVPRSKRHAATCVSMLWELQYLSHNLPFATFPFLPVNLLKTA